MKYLGLFYGRRRNRRSGWSVNLGISPNSPMKNDPLFAILAVVILVGTIRDPLTAMCAHRCQSCPRAISGACPHSRSASATDARAAVASRLPWQRRPRRFFLLRGERRC